MSKTPLLLDTHCWIWMQFGWVDQFSAHGRRAVEEAAQRGLLQLSVISVWELGMLEAKGRLELQMSCAEWVREALATPGLSLAQLSPEIAIESSRLPGQFHGDPVDRILVATVRMTGGRLITKDRGILEYGRQHHASILPA